MAQKRSKNQIRRERAKLRKVEAATDDESELSKIGKVSDVNDSVSALVIGSKEHQTSTNKVGSEGEKSNETIQNEQKNASVQLEEIKDPESKSHSSLEGSQSKSEDVQVPENLMKEFASVFEKFQEREEDTGLQLMKSKTQTSKDQGSHSDSGSESDSDSGSDSETNSGKPLSKRQFRKQNRIPIAELKAATDRPQAVEWFDVDAPDPFLVVKLKTMPNAVDVPSHWQQKKEYLSSKRGVERPPFKLPRYIEDTGIAEMRNHDAESLKKLQRDRVQPKMGKLDIDYQRLHDAFFKFQTKPKLLAFGELYYEGREKIDENRDQIKHMRPGKISKELRAAVGLPVNENSVPPWILLMNELGKPPAYSDCIIPGVDIEYSNLGYRLSRDEECESLDILESVWGHMEDGEESEEEELESEREEEELVEEVGETKNESSKLHSDDEDEPEKVDITEYSRIKIQPQDSGRTNTSSSGTLYTVLKEKDLKAKKDGLILGQQGYKFGERKEEDALEKDDFKKPAQPSVDPNDFKF